MACTRCAPCGRVPEQRPGDVRQPIGLAVAAAEQELQALLGQILHRVLPIRQRGAAPAGRSRSRSRWPTVGSARRRHDPRAPVAEAVPVERQRHRRSRRQIVGHDDVAGARVMDVQHQHHRRRLRTVVDQFVADSELHLSHYIRVMRAPLCDSRQAPLSGRLDRSGSRERLQAGVLQPVREFSCQALGDHRRVHRRTLEHRNENGGHRTVPVPLE